MWVQTLTKERVAHHQAREFYGGKQCNTSDEAYFLRLSNSFSNFYEC